MLRRKPVLIPLAVAFALLLTLAVTAGPPSGADKPWDLVWAAIDDLQDQIDNIPTSTVPAGTIAMWSGSLGSIPSGWALCDGTQGTPDLRERFIQGAADGENPGGTGGAENHDHVGVSHSHGGPSHTHTVNPANTTTTSSGSHSHSTSVSTPSGTVEVVSLGGSTDVASPNHSHSVTVTSGGLHSHSVNIGNTTTSSPSPVGSTSSVAAATQTSDHLPPYYNLAFIMKLAQ